MRKLPQIVPISYRDANREISLSCYADTLVYLKRNHQRTLIAARIGGYPEQVRGMSDAVIGGISLESTVEDHNRERVKLVQKFDALADRIVERAVQLAKQYRVVDEEFLVSQTRKVLEAV